MWNRQAGRKVKAWLPDGTVRTATFTAEADTMFTVPARVSVKGKTISGFVATVDRIFTYAGQGEAPEGVELQFYPRRDRVNGSVLPEWGAVSLI